MANTLSSNGIATNETIEAVQVSQFVQALAYDPTDSNREAYALSTSGSIALTGSLYITGSADTKVQFVNVARNTTTSPMGLVLIDANGFLYSGSSSAGSQGPSGAQGASGTNGAQGATGTGTQGPTGAQGSIGTVGPTGPQGANGTNGAQGAQGVQGGNGTNGAQGSTGAQGTTGAGTQGATGTQGANGTQGFTGPQGANGTNGAQGVQGSAGTNGAQGADGTNGAKGDAGTNGAQGANGDKGDSGAQGASGTNGAQGANGTNGAQGATGAQGSTGAGTQGATGAQGGNGTNGAQGATGETGAQGSTGAGTQGATGAQGGNGTNGAQGAIGAQGATGTGAQGATGAQGTIGAQGAQGTTGDKGEPGSGGLSGALFNNQVRYTAYSSGTQNVQVLSTGNLYAGLTWSRSTTTLTVTSPSHGLTTGNYVVLRNMNVDYVYVQITVTDLNTFTCTVDNSGATSGTTGAYIPAIGITGISQAGMTVTSPSAGNVQVNSISTSTGTKSSSTFDLVMPATISNGGGDNTSLITENPGVAQVWNLSTGAYNGSGTTVLNTSANFSTFRVGSIATLVNNLIRFQF